MSEPMPVDFTVPGHAPAYRGKVREIYDLGSELVIGRGHLAFCVVGIAACHCRISVRAQCRSSAAAR